MSVSTHDPLTLSHSLTLPAYLWSQDLREPQTPPSYFLDSLVQDARGPARLLRIREDILDNMCVSFNRQYNSKSTYYRLELTAIT